MMRSVKEPLRWEATVRGWVAPTAHLMGIGWYFATCIIAGLLIGRWIDGKSGLDPIFTLGGIALGLAVALVGGYRMLIPFINRYGGDTTERR